MCTDNDNLCPVNIGSKSVVLLPPVVVVWLHLTCGCVDDAVDTRLDGSQSARAAAQRSGAAQSTRPTQRSSAAQRCRATQGSCAAQTACRTQGVVWSVVFLQWCQKSTSLKCHKLVMSNFLFSTFFFRQRHKFKLHQNGARKNREGPWWWSQFSCRFCCSCSSSLLSLVPSSSLRLHRCLQREENSL